MLECVAGYGGFGSRGVIRIGRLAVQGDGHFGLLQAFACDRVHECRVDVVRVAPQGRHREPQGRLVSAGGRSLFRQCRQLGGLVPDRRSGEVEPLAAEEWQEHAVGGKGIAEQLAEVGVFLAGVDGRDLDDGRPGGGVLGRAHHGEVEPAIFEHSSDEQDGIAVGTERGQPSGQAAVVRRRRLGREHDVFGPEYGSDGEGPEPRAGVACRSGLVGNEQHAAGGVGEGGEAGPVHLVADADTRHGDALRAELFLECEEIGRVDAVEARPVTDVDDGPACRRPREQVGSRIEHGDDVGRSERCARRERLDGIPRRRAACSREAFAERRAIDIDRGDPKPVARTGFFQDATERFRSAIALRADLTRRGVDEHHHVDGAGRLPRRCRAETDGDDRWGEIAARKTLREGDGHRLLGTNAGERHGGA